MKDARKIVERIRIIKDVHKALEVVIVKVLPTKCTMLLITSSANLPLTSSCAGTLPIITREMTSSKLQG